MAQEASAKPRRTEIRWPDKDTVYTINADGSRNFLHPADVHGRWQIRKNLIFAVLIAVYMVTPWIMINGRPAVHIDIPGRNAFLFGATFTNQDFYLMFFIISGIGFGLFVVTSLWGRIWCGFACPQTVFLEGVYRKIERAIEGPRTQRIRRNMGPWTGDKAWRKILKHGVFVALSFLLANAFVAYFIPARELVRAVFQAPGAHMSAFVWVVFWTVVLYFDYAWFREQTCLIVCPYGRLQSTLIDRDTVVIGYDGKRGEPRSKVNDEGGDCIDCHRCVQVCPTGIDIRNGLQLECVGCANCIDACDDIMDKLKRPRGLIRYDSLRGLEENVRQNLFRRPRLYFYAALGLLGLSVFGFTLSQREPFEVKTLRARGMPYILEADRIRNLYTIRVQNKQDAPGTFSLTAEDMDRAGLEFLFPQSKVRIEGLGDVQVPVFVYFDKESYREPFPVTFTVVDSASGRRKSVTARFLGP